MYSTILVPVDERATTQAAVNRAFDLAQMYGAAVHLLYVIDTGGEATSLGHEEHEALKTSLEKRGRDVIARIHERALDRGLDVTRTIRDGVSHRVILEYAAENDIDAIVMGTHSRTGPNTIRLGSTTERVVTLADVPVLAISETDGVDAGEVGYDHVVIATDGSDTAERAADRGFELADRYDADVTVTYVVDETTHEFADVPRSIVGLLKEGGRNAVEAIAAEGRDRGLSVETTILRGAPEAEIVSYTDGLDGSIVAMGTRGRGGAADTVLGSTTARVLRRATRPILIVS